MTEPTIPPPANDGFPEDLPDGHPDRPSDEEIRTEVAEAAAAIHEAHDALNRALRIAEDLNETRKTALREVLVLESNYGERLLTLGIEPTGDPLFKQMEALRETLEDN